MKKALYAVFAVIFTSAFVFVTVSLALAATSTVTLTPTLLPTPVQQVMVKNDYQLAYPGILPDNKFYPLKVLRDKIIEFFTIDPKKKVDFYLLQTDKQIWMASQLVDKHEIDLAKSTALKAEDNFTKLVFVYRNNGSKPDFATYKKLEKAAQKHQEVLADSMRHVGANDAKVFQQVINFSKTNWDSLTKIYKGQQL